MGQLSGNSCNIITILPLGIKCNSVNASTPDATNGVIALYVTGGTPPYNIVWNNGLQGSPISNLLPGNYTATVTDYYGDFTTTTTCNVGYDSFYLEKFQDCGNSGNFIYYLANLPSTFINGKIYKLTTQTGCWISSGTTLYTGQTYINNFANTSHSPYTFCFRCLPAPVPPIVYPNKLCMNIKVLKNIEQVEFSSGSTINGYPSWTSSTPTYTIYYNTGMTRWEILNWSGSGVPSYNYPIAPPVGIWSVNGAPLTNITVSSGECVSTPMTLKISETNPSCVGVNNGVISVNVLGGDPGYTYSLNGVTYQPSSTFVGLSSGNYTVYVKDSSNNIITQTVTLIPVSSVVNYVLNLTLTPIATQVITNTTTVKTWYWRIDVSPTLPPTKTISFDVNFSVNMTGTTNGSRRTITTNTISGTPINTSTLGVPTVGPVSQTSTIITSKECETTTISTSAYTATYSASITDNGYITGIIDQSIFIPTSFNNRCVLTATISDTMTINVLSLSPNDCSTISNLVNPQYMSVTKNGVVILG